VGTHLGFRKLAHGLAQEALLVGGSKIHCLELYRSLELEDSKTRRHRAQIVFLSSCLGAFE
jgi:hypothetical protein